MGRLISVRARLSEIRWEDKSELCNAPNVAQLAQVLRSKDSPRGASVCWKVNVTRGALVKGTEVVLELPRRLPCARCRGGGCDTCERKGALSLRAPEQPKERLTVVLSQSAQGSISLRIPDYGARGLGDVPRGDLELTLCEADVASPCVLSQPAPQPRLPQAWLLWAAVALAVCLIYVAISVL